MGEGGVTGESGTRRPEAIVRLDWMQLHDGSADESDGRLVEIEGWLAPFELSDSYAYFLLVP